MKIHYLASAAASVLALSIAAPAFAASSTDVSGFIDVWGGASRNHVNLTTDTPVAVRGAVAIPAGPIDFQVEGAYTDTTRDALALSKNKPGDTSFDNQTAGAASVFKRTDKWAFGATASEAQLGDIDFNKTNGAFPSPSSTETIGNITSTEGSLFAAIFGDKFVGSVRVAYGAIKAGDHIVSVSGASAAPTARNETSTVNYADATANGDFFINNNALIYFGFDYKDLEKGDPVLGSSLGLELKTSKSPLGAVANIAFDKFGDSINVGIVGTFGASTLADRDKKGPVATLLTPLNEWQSLFIADKFIRP